MRPDATGADKAAPSRFRRTLAPVAVLGVTLLAASLAHGHGLEPALLSLRELSPGRFEVVWKSSKIRLPGAEVRPVLPDSCRQTGDPPRALDDGDRVRLSWTVDCGAAGLAGRTVGVADLDVATVDALLHIETLDRRTVQMVLTARHPSWTAPANPTPAALFADYLRLGAESALAGADRLLLLIALLLLLLASPRRLVQAGAAFLIGHAAALAVVAVGDVAPPPRLVAVAIVVGLLVLAVRLARPPAERRQKRWTSLLGVGFGMLSGITFATAFTATAASNTDAPLALLAFGSGTTLTQLAAIAATISAALVLRPRPRLAAVALRGTAYAMGILAVFWCLEHLAS